MGTQLNAAARQPDDERRFDRGAWITLLLVLFLLVWSAADVLYYFSLPTDGWLTTPPASWGASGYVYQQNLMGVTSGLQPNDHLIGINGLSLNQALPSITALRAAWQVGNRLRYTVQRNGATAEVDVPVVQWQLGPALEFLTQQSWRGQAGGLSLVGQLIFVFVAALAFARRPGDHAARALFFFAALLILLTAPSQVYLASPVSSVFVVASVMGLATIVAAYTVLGPPALLQFALVFPRPKPSVKRHPYLEYLPYLIGAGMIPLFVLTNGLAGFGWTILSIVGAIVILIHSAFTMRDAISRAQLRWGLWGFVVGMSMFLTTFLIVFGLVTGALAEIVTTITSLSFSVIGITLAVAILRYRLFDIDVIIRKTLVYSVLTALLALIYFGGVVLLEQLTRSITASSDLAIVISTLVIAALFFPLRRLVQNAIDKRFYRRKYDAAKTLAAFSATIRDEVELEKLTGELVNVVNETMQPTSVSLWLKKTASRKGQAQ